MKDLKNDISNIILFVTFMLTAVGCSDDFLDQELPHLIAPDNLFVNEEGFDAGLNGLYALVRMERAGVPSGGSPSGTSNNPMCSMMMGGTDVIYGNRPWNAELFLNDWGVQTISNAAQNYFEDAWNWLYEITNTANTIINRAENYEQNNIDTATLNRIIAEARTIRAWAYRHLTFLFGDVPLVLEESSGENVRLDWERTPVADIYRVMLEDLEFGAANLPETHLNDAKIVRAVAQTYLSELQIILEDYTGAIETALAAVNGPRSLITNRYGVNASSPGSAYSDQFLIGNINPSEGNTEVLWVFQNEYEVVGGEGHNIMRRWFMSEYSSTSGGSPGLAVVPERGGRGQTRLSATKFQLDLYRDGSGNVIDDRGDAYSWRTFFTLIDEDPDALGVIGDSIFLDFIPVDPLGDRFRPYTRKWDSFNDIDPISSRSYDDYIYLRLADTYLLLAEAYFKNGDPSNAAFYINELRNRANASNITSGDVTIDLILDERARELFSEEHRRYTLLRNAKWIERTNLYNTVASGNIDPARDRLYPIPQSFIDSNLDNEISNNPGY